MKFEAGKTYYVRKSVLNKCLLVVESSIHGPWTEYREPVEYNLCWWKDKDGNIMQPGVVEKVTNLRVGMKVGGAELVKIEPITYTEDK